MQSRIECVAKNDAKKISVILYERRAKCLAMRVKVAQPLRLSLVVSKASKPYKTRSDRIERHIKVSITKHYQHQCLRATLLVIMLPQKRTFVDISSADESDNSTNVGSNVPHKPSNASSFPPSGAPVSPSICLGMVSTLFSFLILLNI
jgi:hypothetical protein